MDSLIQISKINDFLFCPRSLFFHSIYESWSDTTYHASPQVRGRLYHAPIDEKRYGSDEQFLQGYEVYSDQYGLIGKIDLYDRKSETLIERKTHISCIHDGYRYQLYAQYLALVEMGFPVRHLVLRSVTENRSYDIPIPDADALRLFEDLLRKIRETDIETIPLETNLKKCVKCIYRTLCRPE